MDRAIAIAVEEFPEMKKFQEQGTLKAFSECFEHAKLDGLDREFYDLDERLSALRIKYIRAQPDLFVGK